jgi:hypothetical protein
MQSQFILNQPINPNKKKRITPVSNPMSINPYTPASKLRQLVVGLTSSLHRVTVYHSYIQD